MKKQTGIWIDGSKAIIVSLSEEKHSVKEIKADIENRIYHDDEGNKGSFMGNQHVNNEKKFEERKKHQVDNFLENVIEHVKHDDELFVFGPAEIKLRLRTLLENDKHILPKLKSVETSDSMTLNQMVARVKDFYEK